MLSDDIYRDWFITRIKKSDEENDNVTVFVVCPFRDDAINTTPKSVSNIFFMVVIVCKSKTYFVRIMRFVLITFPSAISA